MSRAAKMWRRTVIFFAVALLSLSQTARGADQESQDTMSSSHSTAQIGSISPGDKTEIRTQLNGSASMTQGQRDCELGGRALKERLYEEAQQRLKRGLIQLKKTGGNEDLKAIASLELAESYLGLEQFTKAEQAIEQAQPLCFKSFNKKSKEAASYYADLAELKLSQDDTSGAAAAAAECLRICSELDNDPHQLAMAKLLKARVLCRQSYYEEAASFLKQALSVLELKPGRDRLDYAEALAALSIVEKKLGKDRESEQIMQHSLALKTDAVSLDKTPEQKGIVKFDWIEGIYGSRQIVDPVYPLKYMVVGGLRVSCTLVRSYKHLGVLISLANCSREPLLISVGPVKLEKLKPGRKFLEFCDPGLIDEELEEQVIMDRTWRRRILCHIQKSRRIPGYLKNGILDQDDFFGNNSFGLYGAWENNLRDTPPVVTREQYFYDERPRDADRELLGFMRSNGSNRPTYIETGGARTGMLFFLRERYEDALVRIRIGNAELRFPFHAVPGQ